MNMHLPKMWSADCPLLLSDSTGNIDPARAAEGHCRFCRVLIEYGAGAGVKTELVLGGLRNPRGYVPIDIADAFLAETSKRIASLFPSLWVRPIERNFLDAFEVPFDGSGGGRTGFFPGSTMGNLNTIEAKNLLTQMGRHLGDGGRAIIGVDLRKNVETLLRAYDDSAGVTAAFNLNLLERINTELGGDFRLEQFKDVARWNEIEKAVEMHLVSGLLAVADGKLPRLGRMRTGSSACSDSFATQRPIVELLPVHALAEYIILGREIG